MQHAVPPQYMAARPMPHPNDAALRRSRKPTDRNLPDGIEDVIIGEGVQQYKNLRDLEKRLDAAVVRKRLDIQDSINKTVKKYRTMRIWISNTVESQPWQAPGNNPGSGRYKVRIEGRLLDDETDPTVPDQEEKDQDAMDDETDKAKNPDSKNPPQRFSQFFKNITIDFDKPVAAIPEEVKPVNWSKPIPNPNSPSAPSSEFDSLQFSRASQENLNVTISLVRDEVPERYKLSKELAEVLDVEEETRSGIVLGIWDYIRAMELQEDEEKRQVRCDHRLRSVCSLSIRLVLDNSLTQFYRSSDASKCSSPRSPKVSAPTPAQWNQSSFLTLFVWTRSLTPTPRQPSTISRSQLKTRYAPR
jgi:SWI/SNF-related matrix-associated actin-dependent regulator of chromatin subfamily D